jgi:hypothetical protein
MSSDTWAGVATIFRNLALNWTLFLPLFLLLVWVPKVSVLIFEIGRNWLTSGDGAVPLEPGSPAFRLLTWAAALYVFAELFTSRQLIIQEQHGGPPAGHPILTAQGRNAMTPGAASYLFCCLSGLYRPDPRARAAGRLGHPLGHRRHVRSRRSASLGATFPRRHPG